MKLIFSLLLVAFTQISLAMNPEPDENPRTMGLTIPNNLVDLSGKIEKASTNKDWISYFINKSDFKIFATCTLTKNFGAYYQHSKENSYSPIAHPQALFEEMAKKFKLQQGTQLSDIAAQAVPAVSISAMHSSATAAEVAQIINPKTQQQQDKELRAAVQPGHAYWQVAQASDDFDDWVEVSQSSL